MIWGEHRQFAVAGIVLRSDVVLPGAWEDSSASAAPLTCIWTEEPPPDLPPALHRGTGRFAVGYHQTQDEWAWSSTHGTVRYSSAQQTLTCHIVAGVSASDLASVLVRRILPRMSALLGNLVLHAAAVGSASGVTLIAGRPGAGKSTLATALNQTGLTLFSDDLCALFMRDGIRCVPTSSITCLRADSTEAFDQSTGLRELVPGYQEKYSRPASEWTSASGEVSAVYLLNPPDVESADDAVAAVPLSKAEALARLRSHMLRSNPSDERAHRHDLQLLLEFVARIPAYALSYPRRHEVIPQVARTLSTLMTAPAAAPRSGDRV